MPPWGGRCRHRRHTAGTPWVGRHQGCTRTRRGCTVAARGCPGVLSVSWQLCRADATLCPPAQDLCQRWDKQPGRRDGMQVPGDAGAAAPWGCACAGEGVEHLRRLPAHPPCPVGAFSCCGGGVLWWDRAGTPPAPPEGPPWCQGWAERRAPCPPPRIPAAALLQVPNSIQ